jgi:perosamine synthetase
MIRTPEIAFSRPCFGIEEERAAAEVIRSRWVVGGSNLMEFERLFAIACGVQHAVGVSSWTTGAFLLLKALGIDEGDEVIVPSLTFIASVNVIVHAGATPVFADIDPATYNIDPADVERKITSKTRAILPVDQIGLPCEIDILRKLAEANGLLVIQDAACSFGSRFRNAPVGSHAPVAVFSLHARKVITTGEGGMIVTNDEDLATRLRRLRHQGMSLSDYQRHNGPPTTFETYPEIGYNFRITDIQAAIGLAQLQRLEGLLARRSVVAGKYSDFLAGHPFIAPPHVPEHVGPNWQSYQVRLRQNCPISRNAIMDRLHAKGIPTRRGVMASHLEPPYAQLRAQLPMTEMVAATTIQLPIYPDLDDEAQDYIIEALAGIFDD